MSKKSVAVVAIDHLEAIETERRETDRRERDHDLLGKLHNDMKWVKTLLSMALTSDIGRTLWDIFKP